MFSTSRFEALEKYLGVENIGFNIYTSRVGAGELGELRKENRELRKALFLLAEQLGYAVDLDSPKITVTKKRKVKRS